jgi:hypothetical protein
MHLETESAVFLPGLGMRMLRFPNTGNSKLDWAIVLFGFFLFVMKAISSFRNNDNQ